MVTRRNFLKLTASAPALAGAIVSQGHATERVTEIDYGIEQKTPVLCRMCAQSCPMFAVVRDGRVVRMEVNHASAYAGICGRGKSASAALYSPDRVKTPLLRVGERGEGKFVPISWEEALNRVGGKLKEIRDQGDSKKVAYLPRFRSAPMLDNHFFGVYGTPNISNHSDTCDANALVVGLSAVWGGNLDNGVPYQGTSTFTSDYENAKYAVLLGRNPGGGLVTYPWGVMFGRGKANGLKVTAVDPRLPSEAGESDAEWLPIRPGTDSALLLGLIHEFFKNEFYDAAFLRQHTNSDMLVDSKTLQPVKLVIEDKKGDYLVFDGASGSAVMKSQAIAPELFGEFQLEVDGRRVSCKTGLQLLKESALKFDLDDAEKISGIPKASIVAMAARLNQHKPAAFIERGYRAERYANSMRDKFLISVANVLLGNIGAKGGNIVKGGMSVGRYFKTPRVEEKNISHHYMANDPYFRMGSIKGYRRLMMKAIRDEVPYRFRMVYIDGQNLVGASGAGDELGEALKLVDMVVHMTPFLNETSQYADIVLPSTLFLERDEPLSTGFKAPFPVVGVNRKVIEPLYGIMDSYHVILELAKRSLSADEYKEHFGAYEKEGIRGIWEAQYAGIRDDLRAQIGSLEQLLRAGLWTNDKISYGQKAKSTPTGLIEIYSTYLAKTYGDLRDISYAYAEYANPLMVYNKAFWQEEREQMGKDEFIPITGFSPLNSFTGGQTKNNPLIVSIAAKVDLDAIFINRDKGVALGLKDGDWAEVYNISKPDKVSRARVRLTELVHPEAMFSYYGFSAGYIQQYAESLRHVSPGGFNPNHVSDFKFIPLTGGHPAQDFIVKIRRAS